MEVKGELYLDGSWLVFCTWSSIILRSSSSAWFSFGSVEIVDCDDDG